MQRTEMTAAKRQGTGKGPARQARREGMIPAVLYGAKTAPVPLRVSPKHIQTALAAGANTLITLKVEGDGGSRVVMIKDYQVDPVRRALLHADLYEVRMDRAISVEVPIQVAGKAEGVKAGGILEQVHRSVMVECLPDRIPDAIEVDVTPLNIGQSIHAGELTLPEGVKLKTAADDTIVTVVAPQAEVTQTPEEQEAALKASLAGPEAAAQPAAGAGPAKAAAPAGAVKGAAPAAAAGAKAAAQPAAGAGPAKGGEAAKPAGGGKK
jgi:large subunit ribosomal protein L25